MPQTKEEKFEKQRLNLRRWRANNREHYNKIQLVHSSRYQKWGYISKKWLKNFPPDLFV